MDDNKLFDECKNKAIEIETNMFVILNYKDEREIKT